jgi:hypothetical protein
MISTPDARRPMWRWDDAAIAHVFSTSSLVAAEPAADKSARWT